MSENKWNAEQTVENTILSLKYEAKVWLGEELDKPKVNTDIKFDFDKLLTELKSGFESAFSESDILSEVGNKDKVKVTRTF